MPQPTGRDPTALCSDTSAAPAHSPGPGRPCALDRWLSQQIRPRRGLPGALLILCRTQATVHSVRGWLARRGGLAGVEVATPRALAAQLDGPWLGERDPSQADLPDTPFAARVRARPGLVAGARARVRELRLHRLADPQVQAPPWLVELADSPWEADITQEARLLQLARAHGPALTASLGWSRVLTLGFAAPLDPWTEAVHRALAGPPPAPGPSAPLRTALGVPDTAAEARVAALHAADDPQDTLILVQHDATAARIHRALGRAGLPSAWRAATRLDRHTLAGVIRRCVPWFDGAEDPALRAVDLHAVLRHPMVLGRLPPPAEAWLRDRLAARDQDPDRTALSPRAVASALRRARHLDAPLSRWIDELQGLGEREDGPVAGQALRLLARLKVLQACARGHSFRQAFGGSAPEEVADWGDVDALVADLLGDQDPDALPGIPAPGTLGALRRFLLACRLRTAEDPASLRILGALRRGAGRPATRLEVAHCLQGVVEKGEIRAGVEILTYEDWDGRPCGTLVLADLHDQGLGARPAPDPLLTDAQIAALGGMDGRARVQLRLDQLGRACARALRVVALVSARDAMGRAVVPPVQLDLDIQPLPTGPYGLRLAGPEAPALSALRAVPARLEPPASADPVLAHLAVQATAEWSRQGQGPLARPPVLDRTVSRATLGHHLLQRPSPPPWLGPWLGEAGEVPEAALPDAPRSATGFFNPLARCLYQAYARVVLRLDEPESVNEELDPREIGQAAHAVLQAAALRGAWSTDGDLEAVRAAFTEDLRAATGPAFDQARDRFGALSPARRLATQGLEARWRTHWGRYAAHRVRQADLHPDERAARELVLHHPRTDLAVDALAADARQAELEPLMPWTLRDWVTDMAGALEAGESPSGDGELTSPSGRGGLPLRWATRARGWLAHPRLRDVAAVWREARRRSHALTAGTLATAAELPLGLPDRPRAQLGTLHDTVEVGVDTVRTAFGEHAVELRGSVDRVTVVGLPHEPLLRVVDYKSRPTAPSAALALRRLHELLEPQLVVYALALRQAVADGTLDGPLAGAKIATLGWDDLRATGPTLELVDPLDGFVVDDPTLDQFARALGKLIGLAKQGSWSISPHPESCPELKRWGADPCPFAGACRLRAVPAPPSRS